MAHFLVLVRSDVDLVLWGLICHLHFVRNGARANALVLDVVDDVLHFLLVNVHCLIVG